MASSVKKSRAKCNAGLWTKEKTIQLIELFEECSDLWNVSSKLYCNRNHKQKLHEEIAEKLGIEAKEVAAKLHNLRCQYNGELRKLRAKKSGSGTDELYVPRWEFFNTLKFLSNAGQSCSTTSNLLQDVEEDSSSKESNMSGSESCAVSPCGSYRKRKGEPKPTMQKDIMLSNAMKILAKPADSHQIFGDFIADQMRNMSEAKQKRLKLLIQKAVITVEEEPEPILIAPTIPGPAPRSTEQTSSLPATSTQLHSSQASSQDMFDRQPRTEEIIHLKMSDY